MWKHFNRTVQFVWCCNKAKTVNAQHIASSLSHSKLWWAIFNLANKILQCSKTLIVLSGGRIKRLLATKQDPSSDIFIVCNVKKCMSFIIEVTFDYKVWGFQSWRNDLRSDGHNYYICVYVCMCRQHFCWTSLQRNIRWDCKFCADPITSIFFSCVQRDR